MDVTRRHTYRGDISLVSVVGAVDERNVVLIEAERTAEDHVKTERVTAELQYTGKRPDDTHRQTACDRQTDRQTACDRRTDTRWTDGRMDRQTFGLVRVEFNAPPDTLEVISEAVFTANNLTDTDKQNSTGKYKLNTNTDRYRQTDRHICQFNGCFPGLRG